MTQDKLIAWLSTDILLRRVPPRSLKAKGKKLGEVEGTGTAAEADEEEEQEVRQSAGEARADGHGGDDEETVEGSATGSLYSSGTIDTSTCPP